MGDVDVVPTPNANTARSVFLGDRIKGPFTANVGFVTLAFDSLSASQFAQGNIDPGSFSA
jgi:hypothetical protein